MSLHGSSHSYQTPPCTSVSGPSCTEARSACNPTHYQLLTDVYIKSLQYIDIHILYINVDIHKYVHMSIVQTGRERERERQGACLGFPCISNRPTNSAECYIARSQERIHDGRQVSFWTQVPSEAARFLAVKWKVFTPFGLCLWVEPGKKVAYSQVKLWSFPDESSLSAQVEWLGQAKRHVSILFS